MKFIVSGKNIEVTEALKERAIKKLGKLEKFFKPNTEAQVTMSVSKNRHILEVTIYFDGGVMRAEVENDDMYSAIDKAVERLESQIRKNKSRLEKRLREGAFLPENFTDGQEVREEDEFRVVRSKKFAVKPMTVEEAILQMNLLGHSFFVFKNSATGEVNVVYRRRAGDYGLIEPEL